MEMSGNDGNLINEIGSNPMWLAIVYDDNLHELLTQVALKNNYPLASVRKGNILDLRNILTEGIEPKVVVVDLTLSTNLLDDAKKIHNYCSPHTHIIIIGKEDHISTFRELRHIGITDYLVLPVTENEMSDSLEEAAATIKSPLENEKNVKRITSVIGVRGGVGASTFTTNAAWATFRDFKKKICVTDLDLYNSAISILLDLVPNIGLNDLAGEISRVDEVYFKRLLLQKEENFSILTGQLGLEQAFNLPVEATAILLPLLRDNFDYIYVDVPHSILYSPFVQAMLAGSDNIVVVTDLSLPSVQAFLRIKSYLTTFFPNVQTQVVANNLFPDGGTVSKEMFEKATSSPLQSILPYCQARMLDGLNAGEPFVKTFQKHLYSRRINALIPILYPQLQVKEPDKSTSFLKSLLRFGK